MKTKCAGRVLPIPECNDCWNKNFKKLEKAFGVTKRAQCKAKNMGKL